MSQKEINPTSVSILGRFSNALVLEDNGSVVVTTNIRSTTPTVIKIDPAKNEVTISGGTIHLISSKSNTSEEFSTVPAERLTEILQWIIQVMMSHSHPPNSAPIPDFFRKAEAYLNDLRSGWMENSNVLHK